MCLSAPPIILPDGLTVSRPADFHLPRLPYSGITDVSRQTSARAATDALPLSARTRRRVFDAIQNAGTAGLTDSDMETTVLMSGSTVRPRRIELVRAGLVEASAMTRTTASGRHAAVWVVCTAPPETGRLV